MPAPTLHFWDWSRPVLEHAVAELMQSWRGTQLDLTDTVIVVPTAECGRRLREALAVAAAEKGGAVMAPHLWSPEVVLTWQVDRDTLATPLQEQLVWASVLEEIDPGGSTALFPTAPGIEHRAWADGVAKTLVSLRRTAGAGGLFLSDIAQRLAQGQDADRWRELAALEAQAMTRLGKLEVRDSHAVKRANAAQPVLPEGVRRVIVCALVDPPPLLREWITNTAAMYPVEVFVHAPESERARFDALGVPLVKAWTQDAPRLDLADAHLHMANQPEEQAVKAVALLRSLVGQGRASAVGLADPDLASHVVGALAAQGVRAYDPAGKAAGQHPLLEVLRTWLRFHQGRTWRQLAIFLRQDDVLSVVCRDENLPQARLLSLLDDFHAERMPATLEDALELSREPLEGRLKAGDLATLRDMLTELVARLSAWDKADAPEALRGLLDWIYGAREFRTEAEDDRGYVHLLGEAMRLVGEAHDTAQKLGSKAGNGQLIQTALAALESESLADPRGEVDLVLHGWLELHWEPSPGLVVCGFNDACVPGTLTVDAFLPDHVRERLGLSCQATRCARDACLLTAMHAQRRKDGALHLVLGQTNDAGDVLRPSRLLFACEDSALPARVRHLFPEHIEAPAIQEPPRSLAWKLRPWHVGKKLETVSPSLLSSYLRCPLRCHLEKFISMEPVDASQREMSAGEFGNLAHAVLALFGRDEAMRDCFSEKEIAAFLDDALTRLAREHWGARPLLSTTLQIETVRQRLQHAARVQADLRSQGWRIEHVEFDLHKHVEFKLGGVLLKARADRVDRNTHDGALRIWDYKTRHKAVSPEAAHCATTSAEALEDDAVKWKCFPGAKGRARQWTDLQLPLYVLALQTMSPDAPKIEAGYFHLPAAVTETKAEVWTTLDEAMLESARSCAVAAVERLQEGVFWPPSEDVSWDAFEELFLGDAVEAVMEPALWKGGAS